MTCLMRVEVSQPALDRSLPCPEDLKPPCGISATNGMCVLIHTHPQSRAADTRSARDTSFVHTDDASPYSVPLAQAIASSSSENACTVITGPNISCWT